MQFFSRRFLYAICSGHKLAVFAKEKLACEILFGQLNGSTTESVKDVLRYRNVILCFSSIRRSNEFGKSKIIILNYRLAFAALENDFLKLIDETIIQKVQQQLHDVNGLNHGEVRLQLNHIRR